MTVGPGSEAANLFPGIPDNRLYSNLQFGELLGKGLKDDFQF